MVGEVLTGGQDGFALEGGGEGRAAWGRDEKGSRANRGKEALLLPWEEG